MIGKAKTSSLYLILISLCSFGLLLFPNIDANTFDPLFIGDPTPPSFTNLLGTDNLGRDLLLRCLDGARISLLVGFISVTISVTIGTFIGIISGYKGGLIDEVIMRILDIFMAIPTLFLILTIQVLITPSIFNVMLVIGLTSWMGVARLVRAEVMSLKERTFVLAAKSRNIPRHIILFKHILPHTLSPVIVAAMLGMGSAILTESVLSFLGLGVQPPHASWGNMLDTSLAYLTDAPWMAIAPGIFITITVLSLNFLGDSLKSKLDPRSKA